MIMRWIEMLSYFLTCYPREQITSFKGGLSFTCKCEPTSWSRLGILEGGP